MPAKYSHVKKRSASGLLKKAGQGGPHAVKDTSTVHHHGHNHTHAHHTHHGRYKCNPLVDRSISQAMTAVAQLEPAISELERAIARILLLRYEQDIARLFSTRIYSLSLVQLPTFVMRCLSLGGPSWLAWNHNCDEVKDFFRAVVSMDMRQAGDRVATKSVLWSYTAIRQFAMSNNVMICAKRGLHSLRLIPYYPALKAHLDVLEAMPTPTFEKPPHLGSLEGGHEALEDACEIKYGRINNMPAHPDWDDTSNWREKVRYGYEKVAQTLWRVAREFDVHGYGSVLREKLTAKWCECGCSTDHLGEVCERTVREDEEENNVRLGKQREWDGRGSGVYGWETEEEEDIWEIDMDFGGTEPGQKEHSGPQPKESDTSIGEMMEWRYLRAEREKEKGNTAFRKGDYHVAVKHYEAAHKIEPELPHYQLNLAAAYLKLNNWIEAENACTKALNQHQSSKGFYRRARARRMLGRPLEAARDLRAVLKIQPHNTEAINDLIAMMPATPTLETSATSPSSSSNTPSSCSSSKPTPNNSKHSNGNGVIDVSDPDLFDRLGVPKPNNPKDPPFQRTSRDGKKLKIVLLPSSNSAFPPPLSAESLLTTAGFECEHGTGCAHWRERELELKENKNKSNGKVKKVKSERAKEIEKMRAEALSYPSWDKYVVKLV